MDLRALFTEMCDGSGKKGDRGSRGGKTTKESLSSSRLARGLKHAGLPLDRALVNLLVAAFSTSGGGRHHSVLSYTDFHRMVHCDGLLAGVSAMLGAGGGGAAGTLDEQVRRRREATPAWVWREMRRERSLEWKTAGGRDIVEGVNRRLAPTFCFLILPVVGPCQVEVQEMNVWLTAAVFEFCSALHTYLSYPLIALEKMATNPLPHDQRRFEGNFC